MEFPLVMTRGGFEPGTQQRFSSKCHNMFDRGEGAEVVLKWGRKRAWELPFDVNCEWEPFVFVRAAGASLAWVMYFCAVLEPFCSPLLRCAGEGGEGLGGRQRSGVGCAAAVTAASMGAQISRPGV